MGSIPTGQIEMISTNVINMDLCKYENIIPNINWNDKEPSWDGAIYLYSSRNHKKELLEGKIPVQVKGTEVKKLSNKFISFNIKISDLRNYLNDGGVIFFVVEITSKMITRIFYRVLLPVDLKNYIHIALNKGQKSISIKIDRQLEKETDFDKTCSNFLMHKKLQSQVSINNSISIDEIKNIKQKGITIIGEEDPFDTVNKGVYVYVKDEFNNYVPINRKIFIEEISCTVETDLVVEGKKYFENYKIIKNDRGRILELGDKILYNIDTGETTLQVSQSNIIDRLNTLEFFIREFKNIDPEVDEKLSYFNDEVDYINRILEVCQHFNIDCKEIKLSNITTEDEYFLTILERVKEKEYDIDLETGGSYREVSMSRIAFCNKYILVMKIKDDNGVKFFDYFDEDSTITLTIGKGDEESEVSRFTIIDREGLLSTNFNKNTIIKSIKDVKIPRKDVTSNSYILFALECIKAWDINKNNDYLDLANYILDWIEMPDFEHIITVNKAQIETRLNKKISNETIEKLYKIKFSTDDLSIKAAISILLNDTESFNKYFKLLDDESREEFLKYPIYTLQIGYLSR